MTQAGTASALAFLASIVKDHGAVQPVVALLKRVRVMCGVLRLNML